MGNAMSFSVPRLDYYMYQAVNSAAVAVASLGLVSHGVFPLFFPEKKLTTFLVIAVGKVMTFFIRPTSFVHCSLYIQPHF